MALMSPNMNFDRMSEQLDTQTRNWFQDTMRLYRHDIRGRITSIKINIALLERKSGEENQEIISRLKDEVAELTRMIERLKEKEDSEL